MVQATDNQGVYREKLQGCADHKQSGGLPRKMTGGGAGHKQSGGGGVPREMIGGGAGNKQSGMYRGIDRGGAGHKHSGYVPRKMKGVVQATNSQKVYQGK